MTLILALAKLALRLVYLPFRLLPIRNKVVMLSRESDTEPIDFVLLRQALGELSPDTEVVAFCRKQTSGTNPLSYSLFLLQSLYHIATAKVAVTDTYSIPLCVLGHKGGQSVVQIWHALGAVKQFSYQSLDRPGGRSSKIARQMCMHRNYDYILCTSQATREIYADAFRTPAEKILPIGMPRVDYIQLPAPQLRERFLTRRPELRGKLLLLYLPTFREGVEQGVQAMMSTADAWREQVALLVKPHPLSRLPLPEANSAGRGWSTYDLMKLCDGVITDYSASSLEAGLLHKPVYFYLFDKEAYLRTQGLNIDPEAELPGACYRTPEGIFSAAVNRRYDLSALDRFCRRYVETAEEDNTLAVARFLCSLLETKVPAGVE